MPLVRHWAIRFLPAGKITPGFVSQKKEAKSVDFSACQVQINFQALRYSLDRKELAS